MTSTAETPKQAARRLAGAAISEKWSSEALHEYRAADGTPLYWRIRARKADGSKWIRPMYVNGNGYELGEPHFASVAKPLYRLDALATKPGAPVWYCEGENCADALAELRVLATTAGSASSDASTDYTPLAKRAVTIWPDNDKPGIDHAQRVAAKLLALGCIVELIDAAALGLSAGDDVVDWLREHAEAKASDLAALPRLQCADAQVEVLPAPEHIQWREPEALRDTIAARAYPVDSLAPIVRDAVAEVAAFAQAPSCLVAASALSVASLACQASVNVCRDSKLIGPVSMYFLVVAESGERKTTCDQYFSAGVREWVIERTKQIKPELARYEAALAAWEAQRLGVRDAIKQKSRKGDSTTSLEQRLRDLQLQCPERPPVPTLIYENTTPEALAYFLAHDWPSGIYLSSEAGNVFGGHGMAKDSMMRSLALLNSLWGGEAHNVSRRTSESFSVIGRRLSVSLMSQMPTLRAFVERGAGLVRGTGFLSRFLIAWPQTTIGSRHYREAPSQWPAVERLNARIVELLNEPHLLEASGLKLPALSLSTNAFAVWRQFHDDVERDMADNGTFADVRDAGAKTAENAARLAAIFHVLEHGPHGTIGEQTMRAAARLATWHLVEAKRLLGELDVSAQLSAAQRLDDWLVIECLRRKTTIMPTREILQLGPNPTRTRLVMDTALRELQDAGRVRLSNEGRRRIVLLNPSLLSGSK